MRTNLLHFTVIAIIMFFGACSNEAPFNDDDKELSSETGPTISLTASMPDDNLDTRVSLTQYGNDIKLKWEEEDKLELVFVQEGVIPVKVLSKVNKVTNEGKTATFRIDIPALITGDFKLYGVYGGGGLGGVGKSDTDPTHAILPMNAENDGSLGSVEEKEHVMLYFVSNKIQINNPTASVIFKHLGSLFSITLKNSSVESINNIAEARLVGIDDHGEWAYNFGAGGSSYDLVGGLFLNTETVGNSLSLYAANSSLPSEEFITFWGWYPPLPNKVWPELKLQLRDANSTILTTSVNTKPARKSATAAGKSFYFYTVWDGTQLQFTDYLLYTNIIDSRDGIAYKTVAIGNQIWMAENLRYLPSVSGPLYGSAISPYYYVHSYHGTDINKAKATDNYKTYGVLYNGPAAMISCPEGWHLPSNAEWTQLIDYLGGKSVAGGKLKEAGIAHWGGSSYPNKGTNETGFTALPGDKRYPPYKGDAGSFSKYGLGFTGYFSSSSIGSYYLHFSTVNITGDDTGYDEYGQSVRCVKTFESQGLPKLTTTNLTEFTQTTVTSGGYIGDDGGASVSVRGVCWNTKNLPTISDSKTEDGNGKGSFTSNITGLIPETTYYIRAYATNSVGTSYGSVMSYKRYNDGIAGSITDSRDGNVYQTITIGNQEWMAENLKYLPSVVGPATISIDRGYRYVYDYDGTDVNAAKATDNYRTYGVLYNWPAAMDGPTGSTKRVCPTGWHLPSDAEWTQLTDYLGGHVLGSKAIARDKLKEAGIAHWISSSTPNTGTNETGFTGLPGGYVSPYGAFGWEGLSGYWWSATEVNYKDTWSWSITSNKADVERKSLNKVFAFAVRCVRD